MLHIAKKQGPTTHAVLHPINLQTPSPSEYITGHYPCRGIMKAAGASVRTCGSRFHIYSPPHL